MTPLSATAPIRFVPVKPAFGEPCNGCGHCCRTEACKLSIEFLNSVVAPCIALEVEESGRSRCGLLTNPVRYLAAHLADDAGMVAFGQRELSPKFAFLLRAGLGCDADDDV